jgi:predicted ATP-dependent protease
VSKSLIERRRSDGFEFNFRQKQSTKQTQKKPNQSGEEIPKKKKEEREREREILEFMHRKARKKERGHGILSCCLLQN